MSFISPVRLGLAARSPFPEPDDTVAHTDAADLPSQTIEPSLCTALPSPARAVRQALGTAQPKSFFAPNDDLPTLPVGQEKHDISPVARLTDALVDFMVDAWSRGKRPCVADIIALCPKLASDDVAVARLLEREGQLRSEWGSTHGSDVDGRGRPAGPVPLAGPFDASEMTASPPIDADTPSVGEELGEFRLESVLGQGSRGTVFLATEPALADRPVVLKVTPRDGIEHLTLARLSHPNIVPLHGLLDIQERGLRVLCMPYLGGTTLSRIIQTLRPIPTGDRTGRDLVRALEITESSAPALAPSDGPARRFLEHAPLDRSLCWIASCLADALDAAHRRQLVHLDIKPSNVLISSDGRPMLLDFHLARSPIAAGSVSAPGLGGTPTYMPPEQREAFDAIRRGRSIHTDVDGRADVFSLGVVLHEALGGSMPRDRSTFPRPARAYPGADPGLAAVVAKCLEPDPRDRYPNAASLAADLRRLLADQPLRGVGVPGVANRLRRWRRRKPHALAMTTLLVVATAAMVALAAVGSSVKARLSDAARALALARVAIERRDFAEGARQSDLGLARLGRMPFARETRSVLANERARALRGLAARELHDLAEAGRRLDIVELPSPAELATLDRRATEEWEAHTGLMDAVETGLPQDVRHQVREDLIDLAIARAVLKTMLAPQGREADGHRDALGILEVAEEALGPDPVLASERARHARALGLVVREAPSSTRSSDSARAHDALGRSLLRSGDLDAALVEFDRVIEQEPRDLWANFHRGTCAYRLRRFAEAAEAFGACLVLDPERAEFALNRALALDAIGEDERALRDYDRALRLDPKSSTAALNRGVLHFQASRHEAARSDLRLALALGADSTLVHYNLALVDRAEGRVSDALAHLRTVLERDPAHGPASELARRLSRRNEDG